ncbi:MAG: hypothetical protein M4579_004873 [Chaenotheca gracillima]|nr:MAG: hypothetical protein M4579_004873 [Chaenotheca gracillima]
MEMSTTRAGNSSGADSSSEVVHDRVSLVVGRRSAAAAGRRVGLVGSFSLALGYRDKRMSGVELERGRPTTPTREEEGERDEKREDEEERGRRGGLETKRTANPGRDDDDDDDGGGE